MVWQTRGWNPEVPFAPFTWLNSQHCSWGAAEASTIAITVRDSSVPAQQQTWHNRGGPTWGTHGRCLGCTQLQTAPAAVHACSEITILPTHSLGHFNEHKQRGSYDVHLKEINPQILALPPQQGGLQQYLLNKFLLLFLPTIYSYLVATLFFQYVHVTASRTTDQLKNTHLSPPGFVSFCPRGRQDQWGWDEALKAAQPAQLRAVGCRTEAEQRGDSRNVLLKLKMLLQPSQGGTVLPHVPHDEEQPREMLSKSQEQKKRSASQGKTDFSTPLAPSKLPAWSEILYFNIWKKPLTVQLCTVCDLQEIFKIVQKRDRKIDASREDSPHQTGSPHLWKLNEEIQDAFPEREESCNCITFLDEHCQLLRLWVSPEPGSALWRSLGHCAIRSDDFHNRLLSRIQTQIRLWEKEELPLYFSVRARTHCQYFGQLPAAKLLLMSRTLSTFVWELPGWVNKSLCTLTPINISQNEKTRNKSDLLESPWEHHSHPLTARFMLPPVNTLQVCFLKIQSFHTEKKKKVLFPSNLKFLHGKMYTKRICIQEQETGEEELRDFADKKNDLKSLAHSFRQRRVKHTNWKNINDLWLICSF